jgi:HK97 family phage portal protein
MLATAVAGPAAAIAKAGGRDLRINDPAGWSDVRTSWTGKSLHGLTSLEVTTVWACLRLISETVGTIPLHVYRRNPDGTRDRDRSHPLYELLHDSPNGQMTAISFKEALAVALCSQGMGYLIKQTMQSTGRVVALDPVPSDAVEPIFDEYGRTAQFGRPIAYRVTTNGRQRDYKPDEIVPIAGWGGSGYTGFKPFDIHRNSIGIAAVADEYAGRYFANGAATGLLIKYDKMLSPEHRKTLRKAYVDQHQGAKNSGEPMILELGMSADVLKNNMADSQNIETRKHQMAEIARIWKIPPHMLGDNSKATFNNVEHQSRQFLQYTLGPYLKRIEESLNLHLLSRAERRSHYIEFDPAALVMADSKTATEIARSEILTGVLTINERRAQLNRPPVEGGDKPFLQINMAPVDTLPTHLTDDEEKEAE